MDVGSLERQVCQERNCVTPPKVLEQQNDQHILERVEKRSSEEGADVVETHLGPTSNDAGNTDSNSRKISGGSARKEKKGPSKLGSKNYFLRSLSNGVRVLRPRSERSEVICKPPPKMNMNSFDTSIKRKGGGKKVDKTKLVLDDEFSRIRKRFRYILARIDYEQSLIDAYSGEGWKGQSLEKIRPEKELQRAASEILRCKLKIRNLFQSLDALSAEGRLQESLFDSEGQIYSEDIFCAKCGSKDSSLDNDIILCDGVCDRGFHQMCLEPPLLKEKVPPGDEGWLCPACDCKADCVDLVNDYRETELSIEDSWEKVFPEAAAIAAGDKHHDEVGFPSDDSEDNDYDPNGPELDEKAQVEGSGFKGDKQYDEFGFLVEDSDDGDYDPNGPDLDENNCKSGSSSEESDFTSESDGSSASTDGDRSSDSDSSVGSGSSLADTLEPVNLTASSEGRSETSGQMEKKRVNSELLSILKPDPSGGHASPVSGKRHREDLDYKKLHDEMYGNISSDSSDDEDWIDEDSEDSDTLNKEKEVDKRGAAVQSNKSTRATENGECSKMHRSRVRKRVALLKPHVDQTETCLAGTESTSKKGSSQKEELESMCQTTPQLCKESLNHDFVGNSSGKVSGRRFGEQASQRLREALSVSKYPSRDTKEKLAKELGITYKQVRKWFENARTSLSVAAKAEASSGIGTLNGHTFPANTHTTMPGSVAKNSGGDIHKEETGKVKNGVGKEEVMGDESNDGNSTGCDSRKRKMIYKFDEVSGQALRATERPTARGCMDYSPRTRLAQKNKQEQ